MTRKRMGIMMRYNAMNTGRCRFINNTIFTQGSTQGIIILLAVDKPRADPILKVCRRGRREALAEATEDVRGRCRLGSPWAFSGQRPR